MTLKLEEMSWLEIHESIEQGNDTVLILLGSIEQHGPHLPINTDTLIAEELGVRTAKKLGDALVAPIIRPGCSRHHMDFAGTVSLQDNVFKEVVKAHCVAYEKHGFKNIVLLPYHGGNFDPIEEVEPEIKYELNDSNLIVIANLEKSLDLMNDGMKKAGLDLVEPVIHAGASESSVLMAIDEDLVNKDNIEKGYIGDIPVANLFARGLKSFTKNGVLGDPTKANKKAGELILESMSDWYVEQIQEKLVINK
ncbi:MAG: creatininase family protein [Candidatus Saliniplasma sp.]